jgi:hypothetical protein
MKPRRYKWQRPVKPLISIVIRGWGCGVRHSEPFAKRDRKRAAERHFILKSKRAELQL